MVRWERAANPVTTSFGIGSTLPLLGSASGRVFLTFPPRRLSTDLLTAERHNTHATKLAWPDLDLSDDGIDHVVAQVRRDRMTTVDGRFIPGLKAVSAAVTKWQGEAEVAVILIGTRDDVLTPDGQPRTRLHSFTTHLSVPRSPG